MSYIVVRRFSKQNAYQTVKQYKSRSGAAEFLSKNPNKGYEVIKQKV